MLDEHTKQRKKKIESNLLAKKKHWTTPSVWKSTPIYFTNGHWVHCSPFHLTKIQKKYLISPILKPRHSQGDSKLMKFTLRISIFLCCGFLLFFFGLSHTFSLNFHFTQKWRCEVKKSEITESVSNKSETLRETFLYFLFFGSRLRHIN